MKPRASFQHLFHQAEITLSQMVTSFQRADVSFFHRFAPPPGGGGHQFLRALRGEFERRGLRVENNAISSATRACLFNSFNFDFDRLRAFRRQGCRLVHRVDGPIGVYRGRDDGSDARIWQINCEMAEATIFQSQYSLQKHLELGWSFANPCVILNAADPRIFHSQGRIAFNPERKIRLISTSWSDNLNKGAAVYQWLENHLEWDRFEYTFIGRSQIPFQHIRMIPPIPSVPLADMLRQQDIFISASKHDSCSNSLIEALSCGLPVIYIKSGGNPEIAGQAGLGFDDENEIPALLDQLTAGYDEYQAAIQAPGLSEISTRYLEILGFD